MLSNLSFQSLRPPLAGPVWVPDGCSILSECIDASEYACTPRSTSEQRDDVRARAHGSRRAQRADLERPRGARQPVVGDVVDDVHALRGGRSRATPSGTWPSWRALKTSHSRRLRWLRRLVANDSGSVQCANSSPSRYFSSTHSPCGSAIAGLRSGVVRISHSNALA